MTPLPAVLFSNTIAGLEAAWVAYVAERNDITLHALHRQVRDTLRDWFDPGPHQTVLRAHARSLVDGCAISLKISERKPPRGRKPK